MSGSTLKIQTADQPDSLRVHVSDAYRLPPAPHHFASGDLAICEAKEADWVGCRVDAVGTRVSVTTIAGRRLRLTPIEVLAPTPVTLLNLQRRFQIAHAQAAFRAGLEQAGRPRAPRGWTPRPREPVLGERADGWYSARIHEIGDKNLHVVFRTDHRLTELSHERVVPEPPYRGEALRRGQYVLARPGSLSEPWKPVRITSVVSNRVLGIDIDGDKLALTVGDVVPLVHD